MITQDGTTGMYQFFTDAFVSGIYTMTYTPPAGYMLSTTRLPGSTLDPTGQPDPYTLGSGSAGGVLTDFTAAANPFYMSFDFVPGDPEILNNNIPLKGCCIAPVLTVQNGSVCPGSSIDLASLVTSNPSGGTLSYYTSQANAAAGTNPLGSSTVSPASATNYYVRSQTAANCYTVKEVAITMKAATCGTITVTGPN